MPPEKTLLCSISTIRLQYLLCKGESDGGWLVDSALSRPRDRVSQEAADRADGLVTDTIRKFRLAHGLELTILGEASVSLVREFIRPAVAAVPPGMARVLGHCLIRLAVSLGGPDSASRWAAGEHDLRISIATLGRTNHDIAMELLICLGQALWKKLSSEQSRAYWLLLDSELVRGVKGEIDEEAFTQKQAVFRSRITAASDRRLERYGRASFAGTAAEYVHSLWHDVEVVSGPEHLPAPQLRRRLKLLSGWFPPGRGHKLYPPSN